MSRFASSPFITSSSCATPHDPSVAATRRHSRETHASARRSRTSWTCANTAAPMLSSGSNATAESSAEMVNAAKFPSMILQVQRVGAK